MLANEILKLALVGSIPVCGEVLWAELLGLINQFFCVVALFESVLQVIVSSNTTSFLPDWMTALLTPVVLMVRNEMPRSGSLQRSRRSSDGLESTAPSTSHTDGDGSSTSEVRRGATPKIVTLSSHEKCSPLQS